MPSITEIAIIQVDESGVREWSSLVRPTGRIPQHIERMTGISNEQAAHAPRFEELADEVFDRLDGRIFVAHNARFDHGHIKAAFRRIGVTIRPKVLCTVKLSRRLYPHERRHSLDHLIHRHGLQPGGRHRALADALALWQFWQCVHAQFPQAHVDETVRELIGQPTLPSNLDPADIDALPDAPGVYLFYGENGSVLYVGKSTRLRTRVLSHFSGDYGSDRSLRLSQQVRRIEHIRCSGELGALLEEARLIKKLQPVHNRMLRRNRELCAWQLDTDLLGDQLLKLVRASDIEFPPRQGVYGVFRSKRAAVERLRELCAEHRLCPPLLGLEKHTPGRCFTHQLKRCEGGCMGREAASDHASRLQAALEGLKMEVWPHDSPVAIVENDSLHVVDNWCHYGSVKSRDEAHALLHARRPAFDLDTYKILARMMPARQVMALEFS